MQWCLVCDQNAQFVFSVVQRNSQILKISKIQNSETNQLISPQMKINPTTQSYKTLDPPFLLAILIHLFL